MASFSGLVQAAFKFRTLAPHELLHRPAITIDKLAALKLPTLAPGDDLRIASWPGNLHYQIICYRSDHNLEIRYPEGGPGLDRDYAQYLAQELGGLSGAPTADMTMVTHFDNEYGFFRRRLPVWRVVGTEAIHPLAFVDTTTGRLVLATDSAEGWRNLIFSFLHKYNWIDALGGTSATVRFIRDCFSVVISFGIAFVAMTGIILLRGSRRRATDPK